MEFNSILDLAWMRCNVIAGKLTNVGEKHLPSEDIVIAHRDGPVGFIVLNQPETRNALSLAMRALLRTQLEKLLTDKQVRAIVLSGAGIAAVRSYGSTEHPTITTGLRDQPLAVRASTDGNLMAGCSIKIVDESGNAVAHWSSRRNLVPWA